MHNEPQFWFPAKRYGWGWGMPTRWQGWVVLIGFFALLALGAKRLQPSLHPVEFALYALMLSVLLTLICWLKGEAPRWRWDNKK